MSKLYYDHLIVLTDIESEVKNIVETIEEKEELWHLIDEIIHHNILCCVLDNLYYEHHEEFLDKYCEAPHDECLIEYLNEKIEDDIEEIIREGVDNLKREILQEIFENG